MHDGNLRPILYSKNAYDSTFRQVAEKFESDLMAVDPFVSCLFRSRGTVSPREIVQIS